MFVMSPWWDERMDTIMKRRRHSAPAPPNAWRVIPLMITRNVEMAAFLDDLPITFTVVDDLAATLQSDSDPKAGHTLVGSR